MDYSKQRADIDARLGLALQAAESFAMRAWPREPELVEELRAHWAAPREFAAQHEEWFRERWGVGQGSEFDWDARDLNPWSFLQDSLGIRGLAIVVKPFGSANEILGALIAADVGMESIGPALFEGGKDLQSGREVYLHALAERFRHITDRILVQLCDEWSDDPMVATVAVTDHTILAGLACEADIYGLGIHDL